MKQKSGFLFRSARTVSLISVALGVLTLTVASVLTFATSRNYRLSVNSESKSVKATDFIQQLKLAVVEADSVQMGYVLTRNEEYLEPMTYLRAHIEFAYKNLRELISENSVQLSELEELKGLIEKRLDNIEQTLRVAGRNSQQKSFKDLSTGGARRLSKLILIRLESIEDMEQISRKERSETSAKIGKSLDQMMHVCLGLLFVLMIFAVLDIKRRLQVIQKLRNAKQNAIEASETKSLFLAKMSHELRTPLNGINGMIELLNQTHLTDMQKDYVGTLKESAKSLLSLLNDVLDLSKIESGHLSLEKKPFQINHLVSDVVKMLRYSALNKDLVLESSIHEDVPSWISGDELRMRQILINLISNAIKFSSRGRILVQVKVVSVDARIARLLFSVSDQGVGFDEKTKARLFQMFSQGDSSTSRKFGGTGLGLAICKQLVELMGGFIDVNSVPNVGTKFWFEVPFEVASAEDIKASTEHENLDSLVIGDGTPARVLVVDDNKANLKIAGYLLQKMGCEFLLVESGEEALDVLNSEKFDLILMDCQMPGLDGYSTSSLIRNRTGTNRRVPIIASTANVVKGEVEKCMAAGMNDYISKPMDYNTLRRKIHFWVLRERESEHLDYQALGKMRDISSSDCDVIAEVVEIFEESFPEDVEEMKRLLLSEKYYELSLVAHKMKSTCAHLGARYMQKICLYIEENALGGQKDILMKNISELEKEFPRLMGDLKKYLMVS